MNSPQDDPYEILGISRQATDTQIKAAYRKLALRYHPDKNPASSSHAQFTKVSHAYETLRDPQLRAQYDRAQHAQQQQQQQQQYPSFRRPAGRGYHDPFQVFQQVFAEEFGGSSSSTFRNHSSMNRSSMNHPSQHMSSIFDHDDSLFNDPFFSDPFLGGRPRQSSSIRRRDSHHNSNQQQERTNSRGMGPFMGSPFGSMFNGGGGSLFDRFDDMMDSMQRDMEQQQQQQGNSNSGSRSYSSSSYYSSSTSSNNNGSRGERVTTQTTRRIVNGREHVLKERIVHKADGSVERQVLEDSTSSRPYTNQYSLEQQEQPALPSSSDNNTSPESDTPSFWQRRFSRSKDGPSRHTTTGNRPPSQHPSTNEDSDPKRKRTT